MLRGREGSQFVEVDARGRIVRGQGGARPDLLPVAAPPLYTNIDLDLQRYVAGIFGDSLQGGAVAIDPKTGAVLALYSAPTLDSNRFIGGVPTAYYDSLRTDPRQPLYNKALQGQYPPGSTWKLATAVVGLETGAVTMSDHMPQLVHAAACSTAIATSAAGTSAGMAASSLQGAIAKSCDVYFYQLGLKLGLARLVAGGVSLGLDSKAGIDLPEEKRPRFPESLDYFNRKYGAELEPVGRAEPGDRAGRQLADHPQHGAVLLARSPRMARRRAARSCAASRSATPIVKLTPRADRAGAGRAGRRGRGRHGRRVGDQGRAARRQDGNGADRARSTRSGRS